MFITGHFIRLFILIELILSPLVPHLSFIKSAYAQATTCPTGYVYNSGVNRCLLTEEAINAAETRNECMDKTGEERAECFAKNANKYSSSDEKCKDIEDEEQKKLCRSSRTNEKFFSGNTGRLAVATFFNVLSVPALLNAYQQRNSKFKPPASKYLLYVSAFTLMGAEIASIFKFNKKIKEAKKSFDELKLNSSNVDTTDKDNTKVEAVNLQVAAFDIMIKKEEAVKDAAKAKKTFYTAGAVGYAAAGAMAAYEWYKQKAISKTIETQAQAIVGTATATTTTNPASAPCITAFAPLRTSFTALNTAKKSDLLSINAPNLITPFNPATNIKLRSTSLATKTSLELFSKSCLAVPGGQTFEATKKLFHESHEEIYDIVPDPNTFWVLLSNPPTPTQRLMNFLIINSAYAAGFEDELQTSGNIQKAWGIYTGGLLAAGTAIFLGAKTKIGALTQKPQRRLLLSGTLATYSKIMADNAKKQMELADSRIAILTDLKAKVEQSGNSLTCTAAERSSTSNPTCYCYNSDNTRNESRNNSEVCSKEWGKAPSLYGKSQRQKYDTGSGKTGCVNSRNQFDPQCSCRNKKASNGQNSCFKVSGKGFNFGSPLTQSMAQTASSAMNAINSGDYENGALSGLDAQFGAFRKKTEAIVKAMKDPEAEKNLKDIESKLIASLNNGAGSLPNLESSSNNFSPGMSPKQALEEIKKDLKKSSDDIDNSVTTPSGLGNINGTGDDFNLGLGTDPAGGVEEVMAQNFDYGSNDISKDGSANIFDILSLRYKRSGLRRLFEGEKDSTPDAPNADEINP